MTNKKLQEFTNDFRLNYGLDLNLAVKGNNEFKVLAFVNRIENIIYEEIKEKCPSFRHTRLGGAHKSAIYRAMLEQAFYTINNYDMNIFSGIDPVSGGVIPTKEIEARAISRLAKKILKNAGLFYAGIIPRSKDKIPFTTFWPEEN